MDVDIITGAAVNEAMSGRGDISGNISKPKRTRAAGTAAAPTPKSKRTFGRSLAEFPDLSPAEKKFVACVVRGEPCVLGEARAEAATEENSIRATLIRFLALGGDEDSPVHEHGIDLRGAWISDTLDLRNCTVSGDLAFFNCHFAKQILASYAYLLGLDLGGCKIHGLLADGLQVAGYVLLRRGFQSFGEVRMLGIHIGGSLNCTDGHFDNPRGYALMIERARIDGAVFLSKGFQARGKVALNGAHIEDNLYCGGGRFENEDEDALTASGLKLAGSFWFSKVSSFIGGLNLDGAHVASLRDDTESWPNGALRLDGFRYDRFSGQTGPTDAEHRIAWLRMQIADNLYGEHFKPQPWEQLIKVLREMGHPLEAAKVAIEKQRMLRKAGKIGNARNPLHMPQLALHHLYGWLTGFGYRPLRAVLWMFAFWLLGAIYYQDAASSGLLAPTNAMVIANHSARDNPRAVRPGAQQCGIRGEVTQVAQYWPRCAQLPSEYTSFSPWIYSADLILPLVNLQQESDWAPVTSYVDVQGHSHGLWGGIVARWLVWFEIGLGWVVSLLLVAILGKFVEKD